MQQWSYDIVMETPMGPRYGSIRLNENQGELVGTIRILQHENAVKGQIDAAGHCRIGGTLLALMYTVTFCAIGTAGKDGLQLELSTAENWHYQISSIPKVPQGGESVCKNFMPVS